MSIDVEKSGTVRPLPWRRSARFGLGCLLQRGQAGWPEAVEELSDGKQRVGAHQEQVAGAFAAFGDQAGATQDAKVKRHGLLRHGYRLGDLSDSAGLVANEGEDSPPVGVGECSQGSVDWFFMSGSSRSCGRGSRQTHDARQVPRALFKRNVVHMSTGRA